MPKRNVFGLDLSKVNIHCSGDIAKCKQNLIDAGYDGNGWNSPFASAFGLGKDVSSHLDKLVKSADGSVYKYDANGNLVSITGKRIYTIDEANAVAGEKNRVSIKYR